MGHLLLSMISVYYVSLHVVAIRLPSSLCRINCVRLPSLEGGDEEGYGSAWGGVRLSTVLGTSVESRTVTPVFIGVHTGVHEQYTPLMDACVLSYC